MALRVAGQKEGAASPPPPSAAVRGGAGGARGLTLLPLAGRLPSLHRLKITPLLNCIRLISGYWRTLMNQGLVCSLRAGFSMT